MQFASLAPLSIDYYKADHHSQYPRGSKELYSNFTPRADHHFNGSVFFDHKIVVFGLQIFVKDYLIREWNETFFNIPKQVAVGSYQYFMDNTLGAGKITTKHLEDLHDLGYLPLEIRALPEGTRAPIGIPIYTVRNTTPGFAWLTNYIESVMSAETWKPSTYATIMYEYRRTFEHFANLTGASHDFIKFQAHDFSFRGASCREEAMKSGIGCLTSSAGTDSCLAIVGAMKWYNADISKELVGTSVYATEHSTMTSNIEFFRRMLDKQGFIKTDDFYVERKDLQYDPTHVDNQRLAEVAYFRYLVSVLYPTGVISIVSDSFDFWYMMEFGLRVLKPLILARQPDALGLCKVVIRPDSGNPVDIICGCTLYSTNGSECVDSKGNIVDPLSAQAKGAVECLYDIFGYTLNANGFKTLNHVGIIYGDSITLARQHTILTKLAEKRFAIDCILLGVGSYSLCMNSRDTLGFAMKATHINVDNESIDIFKAPKTDDGTKHSARGYVVVNTTDAGLVLLQKCAFEETNASSNELKPVFVNGKLVNETSLAKIRQRLYGDSF